MKLRERLSLIKAGYSKAEIAEIEAAESIDDTDEPDTDNDENDGQDGQPADDQSSEGSDDDTEKPDVDALNKTIADLKKQVEDLQAANVNRDQGDHKQYDPDQELQNIINDFLS